MNYCYSKDGEIYRDEVLEDLIASYPTPQEALGAVYYRGEAIHPFPSSFFNVDYFIEDMMERAYDEHGEYAEDYLTDLSDDKVKELEGIIANWLDLNVNVSFYRVVNITGMQITQEDIDNYLKAMEKAT